MACGGVDEAVGGGVGGEAGGNGDGLALGEAGEGHGAVAAGIWGAMDGLQRLKDQLGEDPFRVWGTRDEGDASCGGLGSDSDAVAPEWAGWRGGWEFGLGIDLEELGGKASKDRIGGGGVCPAREFVGAVLRGGVGSPGLHLRGGEVSEGAGRFRHIVPGPLLGGGTSGLAYIWSSSDDGTLLSVDEDGIASSATEGLGNYGERRFHLLVIGRFGECLEGG